MHMHNGVVGLQPVLFQVSTEFCKSEALSETNLVKEQISSDCPSKFSLCCHEQEKIELAVLYDLCYNSELHGVQDINFYLEEAEDCHSIFEVGIGTGRIAIELLKKGKQVDGVDLCQDRLMLLNNKLQKLSKNIQKNINLYNSNVFELKINKKYDAIFLSFRVFQEFCEVNDKIRLLKWAKDHLSDKGKIVMDVFFTDFQLLMSHINEEKIFLKLNNPNETYNLVERSYIKNVVDHKNQIFSGSWIHKLRFNDSSEKILEESFRLCYYNYNELVLLFELCKLEIQNEFGSFDKKKPIGLGTEMVFVLKPMNNHMLANTMNKV